MAKITDHANILISKNVPAAILHWTEKLGFVVTGTWGDPVDFAILKRDIAYVMLAGARPEIEIVPYWKQRHNLWNAYFWVDDAKAMFEEMKARGAKIDYELCTQPYDVLEFGIQDPDGHDIGFGQPLRKSAAKE